LAHRADRIQSIGIARPLKLTPVFPKKWTAQASEVFDLLRRNKAALSEADIAALFKDPDQIRPHIRDILLSLDSLGCVETVDDGRGYIHAGP